MKNGKNSSFYPDIARLVSLLASYVKTNEYADDLTFEDNNNMVNNKYAFIDWV